MMQFLGIVEGRTAELLEMWHTMQSEQLEQDGFEHTEPTIGKVEEQQQPVAVSTSPRAFTPKNEERYSDSEEEEEEEEEEVDSAPKDTPSD